MADKTKIPAAAKREHSTVANSGREPVANPDNVKVGPNPERTESTSELVNRVERTTAHSPGS